MWSETMLMSPLPPISSLVFWYSLLIQSLFWLDTTPQICRHHFSTPYNQYHNHLHHAQSRRPGRLGFCRRPSPHFGGFKDVFHTHVPPELPLPTRNVSHDVDPHLHAKLAHAEQLWQEAVEDRKKMLDHSGKDRKFPDGYIYPYNVWDFARPSFYCPHDLERVGTLGDGGKVVCGMSRYERECPGPSTETPITSQELIVYSFGVSGDSSFEAALLKRTNCRIWGYDYSVDSWAFEITEHHYPFAKFNKVAIGKETNLSSIPPTSTIHDLMKANGHTYIDLVKMDIEGAEFDALTSWIEFIREKQGKNAPLPFGQLLVEIHFMNEPPGFTIPKDITAWMEWWSSLEKMGLRPVNNEDNWIGDVGSGKPRFMEYTLINTADKNNKLLWA